ncbi:probable G-protein coupled receptor 139 [Scyliorhinus torazame]|uniref:probable G-protein coupled receptor 139 n=1 Tax=Scyliorhinus torazame TaxID=75743 RepID=UPI003B5AB175
MGRPTIVLGKEFYYPILATFGIPGNLLTIVILSRGNCGLSKCITVYMVAMATADLLVMVINALIYHIFSNRFPLSFLTLTPVCKFILYMTFITFDLSVWFTVSFTFDRFVALCCPRFNTRYCTQQTATIVITAFSVFSFLKDIMVLFAYETQNIINKVHRGCRASVAFFSSPLGTVSVWFHSACVVWIPFILMTVFNLLTVHRILMANRARRRLQGHRSETHSDPEMESRRKSSILLFSISGIFILLWLTAALSFVTTRLTNTAYYRGDRTDPAYIATETGAFLKFLSCLQNPCIYAATQRKFRDELKNVLKSPWTLIQRLCRKLG